MATGSNPTGISSLILSVKAPKWIFKTAPRSGKVERQANVSSSWRNFLQKKCKLKIPDRGVRVCSSAYTNNNKNAWSTTALDERIETFLMSLRGKPIRVKYSIYIRVENPTRRTNPTNRQRHPQPQPSTSRAQRESSNTNRDNNRNDNMEYPEDGFDNAAQNGNNGMNDYMNPPSVASLPEDQEDDLRGEGIEMHQIKHKVQSQLSGISNATLLRAQDEIKRLKSRTMRESPTETPWQRNYNRAPHSSRLLEMLFDV